MKIGVSMTSSFPRSIGQRAAGRMMIERATAIRAAGLDSLMLGDHHNTPSHYFQNVPALARLLAEIGTMTAGILYLLPLHHPVLVAEHVGTLAALAEGPLVVIVAAGDDEAQFAPFGVSLKERSRRLEEHLEVLTRLLAGETLSYQGRYHTLTNVAINPTPPEPVQIWVGASARPALQRAGRMSDGWYASPREAGEELQTAANIYAQAARAAGRTPLLTVRRDVYVGESDSEALDTCRPFIERGYRGIPRESLVIGSPDTVIEEFRALHAMGFEHVLVRHIPFDQQTVLASYRRLGNEVLPETRRWGA